jgi:TolA-binding protein
MSAVRCLVLALAVAPLGSLPAQSTAKRVRVRLPDYTWISPAIADAQAQAALAAVGPALAAVGPALASVGPALAAAQVEIGTAHAALAHTDLQLNGLGLLGSMRFMSTRPPEGWAQQDPADSLYRRARRELNSGSYSRAAELFAQIYSKYPRSTYAGDAYYWQAYSLSKRSTDAALRQALSILAEQKVRAKTASTLGDADQLRIRICGQLARLGAAPCAETIAKIA